MRENLVDKTLRDLVTYLEQERQSMRRRLEESKRANHALTQRYNAREEQWRERERKWCAAEARLTAERMRTDIEMDTLQRDLASSRFCCAEAVKALNYLHDRSTRRKE